jgi:hypothetical protein
LVVVGEAAAHMDLLHRIVTPLDLVVGEAVGITQMPLAQILQQPVCHSLLLLVQAAQAAHHLLLPILIHQKEQLVALVALLLLLLMVQL